MAIIINIDVMLAKRKMSVTELTEKVGITMANLSILKNGKAKAVRFSTLEAICKALDCSRGIFWNTEKIRTQWIIHTASLSAVLLCSSFTYGA